MRTGRPLPGPRSVRKVPQGHRGKGEVNEEYKYIIVIKTMKLKRITSIDWTN